MPSGLSIAGGKYRWTRQGDAVVPRALMVKVPKCHELKNGRSSGRNLARGDSAN